MKGKRITDIISTTDFTKRDLDFFVRDAFRFEKMPFSKKSKILRGKIVALLFFEPSTRTKMSFETAAKTLGAEVIGFENAKSTSSSKGETFHDSIKTISKYADLLVIRHPNNGAAEKAVLASDKPVINAGAGSGEHPTQAILDLFTIKKELGKIDSLNIGMIGDLKYGRTVHSLSKALAKYKTNLFLISPKQLKMPAEVKKELNGKIKFEGTGLNKVLPKLDILYVTRIQKERFKNLNEYNKAIKGYQINKSILKHAKKNLKIMHPLPRVNELSTDLDETKNALYFKQAKNGVPVRQALLAFLLKVKNRKTRKNK